MLKATLSVDLMKTDEGLKGAWVVICQGLG